MSIRLMTAVGVIALALAACGDADGDVATTLAPTTTLAGTTTTTSTSTTSNSTTTTLAPPTTTAVPPTSAPGSCSAAGMDASLATQDGLPAPVAATRLLIAELAAACDLDGLAELALEGEPFFSFSFGGGDDPAEFWRTAESQGDPVTRRMIEVLALPYGVIDDLDPPIFAWPELATLVELTDADYDQVRGIYDDEAIESFKDFGGYIGYRAGIQADGDWLSFVAGD